MSDEVQNEEVEAEAPAAAPKKRAAKKKAVKKTTSKKTVKKGAKKKTAAKKTKAAPKKTAKKTAKVKEVGELTPTQIKVLKILSKRKSGLTGAELAEKAEMHPTMVGSCVGYRKQEINDRPVHAGNLVNRGLVKILIPEEGQRGFRYQITAEGRKAAK